VWGGDRRLLGLVLSPANLRLALSPTLNPPSSRPLPPSARPATIAALDDPSAPAPTSRLPCQVLSLVRARVPASLLPPAQRPDKAGDPQRDVLVMVALASGPEEAGGGLLERVRAWLDGLSLADFLPARATHATASLAAAAAVLAPDAALPPLDPPQPPALRGPGAAALLSRLFMPLAPPLPEPADSKHPAGPEMTLSLLRPEAFSEKVMAAILARAAAAGLDVCALRLAHVPAGGGGGALGARWAAGGATLAVVLRGPDAAAAWGAAVGPEDAALARRTDPLSLRAAHGVDRARNLLAVSRTAERGRREAEAWFGPDSLGPPPPDAPQTAERGLGLVVPREEAAVVALFRAGLLGAALAAALAEYLSRGLRLAALRRGGVEARALGKLGVPPAWAADPDPASGGGPCAAPLVCACFLGENASVRCRAAGAAAAAVLEGMGYAGGTGPGAGPARASPGRREAEAEFHGDWVCGAAAGEAALRFRVHLGLDDSPPPVDAVAFAQRVAGAPARWHTSSSPAAAQTVCVAVLPDAADRPPALRDVLLRLLAPPGGLGGRPGGLGAELVGLRRVGWLPRFAAEELCPLGPGAWGREDWLEAAEAGPMVLVLVRLPAGAAPPDRPRNRAFRPAPAPPRPALPAPTLSRSSLAMPGPPARPPPVQGPAPPCGAGQRAAKYCGPASADGGPAGADGGPAGADACVAVRCGRARAGRSVAGGVRPAVGPRGRVGRRRSGRQRGAGRYRGVVGRRPRREPPPAACGRWAVRCLRCSGVRAAAVALGAVGAAGSPRGPAAAPPCQ
jgi:nucleoside diphosphate kinase